MSERMEVFPLPDAPMSKTWNDRDLEQMVFIGYNLRITHLFLHDDFWRELINKRPGCWE